ncbi:carboxylesterase family protein [Streptomyces mobaraensis NBRC 13819 = DSM 40847]|uniref:Carboxylic ester hydrolase n=1 Tax=Streptomyces mobaraensis (strain ATCC 29032 / DSM 40847 / JCM 4168 / NBRC 13819 / NCIMB 11159 / IPCR 16-22) TaxID=1223523 RepID=M3C3T3_STRM1|nr:carboxylesterase family protein [Streptomyces mobaraensis]EME98621.1 carboxylesterase [Streptomyces mobaraensis NBRC 13819 = DSM 40847]QTT72764.1 carboxylesterase family protein [Streptomyces mobaraensis NBRC 13819 = DSM 40847]
MPHPLPVRRSLAIGPTGPTGPTGHRRAAVRTGLAAALLACATALAPALVPAPAAAAPDRADPVVHTAQGALRGRAHGAYETFRGVPYAQPPLGDLRWRAPVPVRPWHGVRDAGASGPRCAQADLRTGAPVGSEDCLRLDVTRPAGRAPARGRPVMVWLHGGAFVSGSAADYPAGRLAARGDAVVVAVEYRLGVFGLFGHPGLGGAPDFTLADQRAALRWVRDNARRFGGDPGRVTLFGESAGALSACAHLVAPESAGLFHRAVLQSGSCLTSMPKGAVMPGAPAWSPWARERDTRAAGEAAARRLGCGRAADALRCLRALPAARLATPELMRAFSSVSYGNRPLPEEPGRALRAGRFRRVPVVQGTNRDEMRYFVADSFAAYPVRDERDYRARLRDAFGDAAAAVERRYPARGFPTPALAWAAVLTDRSWTCTTLRADRLLAARVPVYGYEFADRSAPNLFGLPTVPEVPYGAAHGFELPYLFDARAPFTAGQRALSARMTDAWTRFARTSVPGPEWPGFGGPAPRVLSLAPGAGGIRPVDAAAVHRCAFWERHGA